MRRIFLKLCGLADLGVACPGCLVVVIVLSTASLVVSAQQVPLEKGKVNIKNLGGYENDFTPGRIPTKEEIAKIDSFNHK